MYTHTYPVHHTHTHARTHTHTQMHAHTRAWVHTHLDTRTVPLCEISIQTGLSAYCLLSCCQGHWNWNVISQNERRLNASTWKKNQILAHFTCSVSEIRNTFFHTAFLVLCLRVSSCAEFVFLLLINCLHASCFSNITTLVFLFSSNQSQFPPSATVQ